MRPCRCECRCTTGDQPPETARVSTSRRWVLDRSGVPCSGATVMAASSLASPAWVSTAAEPNSTLTPWEAACCAAADAEGRAGVTAATPPDAAGSETRAATAQVVVDAAHLWRERTAH